MTTTSHFPPESSREKLFSFYVPLAGRVTSLRSIIQNGGPVSKTDVEAWVVEVKSVYSDFMTLNERTLSYLREHTLEPTP